MTSSEHIDIVIPSRGSPLGLWTTISACEVQLDQQDINYKYTVVINDDEKPSLDTKTLVESLQKSNKVKIVTENHPLSPPQARQLGADNSDGKYIFFFDNHCVPTNGYFSKSITDFEHYDIDTLHSSHQFYLEDITHYHYLLKLKHNFWGASGMQPGDKVRPHKIAAGGHGGFMVKRSSWEEVGKYGPDGLFVGYGGEELYYDLKCWLLGKTVWIDPKIKHFHYAGTRGYARHHTIEFYVNMLVCANVIGGMAWMYKVYESFATKGKWFMPISEYSMFDLLIQASERSTAHCAEIASKSTRTLDELLDYFLTECIPC